MTAMKCKYADIKFYNAYKPLILYYYIIIILSYY